MIHAQLDDRGGIRRQRALEGRGEFLGLGHGLAEAATSGGEVGIATFVQDGMNREVRIGTVDELIAYARGFEEVGTDLLTLSLVDPPGTSGIEQLAAVVEGLR